MLDELIKNRRSIRKYKPIPVNRELIEQCLEAARLAPSACNSQPWHFVVFDDETTKTAFADSVFSGIYKTCRHIADAPVLIAVVATIGGNLTAGFGQIVSGTRYYMIDQAIATEHLVLKAQQLGLGTCWLGWFNSKKAKKALNLPLGKTVEVLIALGHPAEAPTPRPRKTLAQVHSYNEYK